ncbi:MAG: DUF4118 domain-containing protein [Actinomycetota bacterium]
MLEDWKGFLFALLAIAAATAFGFVVDMALPVANISVAYLMAVLVVAVHAGLRPSILASGLGFLAFNFFFTEPRFTLDIADTHNLLTVVFYLVAAVIVSNMASRLRAQVEATRENARRTANLYDFGRKVIAAATRDEVLGAVVCHVADTVHGRALVLLPVAGTLSVAAGHPQAEAVDAPCLAAAERALATGRPAGRGAEQSSEAMWLFLPLQTAGAEVGVLGVQLAHDPDMPPPALLQLLEALAGQAAAAIERTNLVSAVEAARVATERERLRAALMSSLSHDLRTPLVSIMGAASTLTSYDEALDPPSRRDLAHTIQDEAERLNRFVQNLLDMTRLGSGALKPRVDWVDLADVIRAAVRRGGKLARAHTLTVELDPGLPLLCLDAVLMEQAIFNLIDNACKYAPAGTTVKVWAKTTAGDVIVEVADQGPGIPEADRDKVFDMFTRVNLADSQPAGTGLGLAICRGIVEAHGGAISAEAGLHGVGTAIVIRLPLPTTPQPAPEGPAT